MLAERYLALGLAPLDAYAHVQRALMRRFMSTGGSEVEWCERYARAFRCRYGWLLEGQRVPAHCKLPRRRAR